MKLATSLGDFFTHTSDHVEALALVAEAGFRYLDYNFIPDHRNARGAFAPDAPAELARIRAAADRLGLQFVQSHAPLGQPLGEGGEAFVADVIRAIEAAPILGIPYVVIHPAGIAGLSKEENFAANKKYVEALLPAAERADVTILIENLYPSKHADVYWVETAADLAALIDYIDSPRVAAVWDTGHGNMHPMPQHEELAILGKRLRALHVNDNSGTSDIHKMPFLGTMNIDSLMHGLLDIGYDGYFCFEMLRVFVTPQKRNPYPTDTRLAEAPLAVKKAAERMLYETGKCILEAYDVFEA